MNIELPQTELAEEVSAEELRLVVGRGVVTARVQTWGYCGKRALTLYFELTRLIVSNTREFIDNDSVLTERLFMLEKLLSGFAYYVRSGC